MAKMYTVDGKLLVEKTRCRSATKSMRSTTVWRPSKIQAVTGDNADRQILELALGKAAAKKLDIDNMRFPVFSALMSR